MVRRRRAGAVEATKPSVAPAEVQQDASMVEVPPAVEAPEPTAGRVARLRARLSRSQNVFGKGLLRLLSSDQLDDETWEDVSDTLLGADVGVAATERIVARLRARTAVLGTKDPAELRDMLIAELTDALERAPAREGTFDRSLKSQRHDNRPAVVLIVVVNGVGKTTTCGKIARVLIADGRSVMLGAADTFRAAAADPLQTWAERVGAQVVRGAEGADPAAVAFDAVAKGSAEGVDAVVIDTAGRLQNKVGLMDQLGKIKRVAQRHGEVDETLLVLDATTGQNGLAQAKVFTEAVDVTGVVLTKLDGTAKGGIILAVQQELGIPVKLIGLGEGADDLAPFDAGQFADALVGATE
ncbi:MAG: signal recognition particle-docking protein FtsY, partial [Mycobacteriales bacterium]